MTGSLTTRKIEQPLISGKAPQKVICLIQDRLRGVLLPSILSYQQPRGMRSNRLTGGKPASAGLDRNEYRTASLNLMIRELARLKVLGSIRDLFTQAQRRAIVLEQPLKLALRALLGSMHRSICKPSRTLLRTSNNPAPINNMPSRYCSVDRAVAGFPSCIEVNGVLHVDQHADLPVELLDHVSNSLHLEGSKRLQLFGTGFIGHLFLLHVKSQHALLLATMTTQALAVRKHGGGLAPIQHPAQQAGGHPLRSKGGEINSLYCAAVGLINALPSATARLANPTTCVRRAPFTAAPLRSPTRPHAQLVVGCKHNKDITREDSAERQQSCPLFVYLATDTFKMIFGLLQVTFELHFHVPNRSHQVFGCRTFIAQHSDDYSEVITHFHGYFNALNRQVIIKILIEPSEHGFITNRDVLWKIYTFIELLHQVVYRHNQLESDKTQPSCKPHITLIALALNLNLLTPMLCIGYKNGTENCPDRTNCLHPCSNALTADAPLDHCANQQPQGWGDYQNTPHAADGKKATAPHLNSPIHIRLPANQVSPSLATLVPCVQKGAA